MLNDITQFDERAEDAYQIIGTKINLPSWMDFPIPQSPIFTIRQEAENFVIVETGEKFDNLVTAYDHVKDTLKGDVVFDNITQGNLEQIGGSIFMPIEDGISARMLISHTDLDTIMLTKYRYYDFLKLDQRYHENVEDWVVAYSWLQSHPAFYHRQEEYKNDWITDNGLKGMWVDVYRDRKGNPVVGFEHGEWLEDDRTGVACHNYKLDSYGSTFEEAYIALAKKVDTHFDVEGNSKNVDVEPPEYLKVAYDRLEAYNKAKADKAAES